MDSYQDVLLFSVQLDSAGTPFVVNSGAIDYKDAVDRGKIFNKPILEKSN